MCKTNSQMQCCVCEKTFQSVHAYWCKKCSHTLENAPSELRACGDDLTSATSVVAKALSQPPPPPEEAAVASEPVWRRKTQAEAAKARLAVEEAKRRVAAKRARVGSLDLQCAALEGANERQRAAAGRLQQWLAAQTSAAQPVQEALREKKAELVAQLFGLLPVFPTMQGSLRVVNFELPDEDAYHNMDPDEAAAVAGYFVKISSLMGVYLEIALPNEIGMESFRWTIRPRGLDVGPVSLHPRVVGTDNFKLAMKLLEQNVVRLCFDQGIVIRRGHEHEIARNLFRLVSHLDGSRRTGLGCEGPFLSRVVLPAETEEPDDGFVLV